MGAIVACGMSAFQSCDTKMYEECPKDRIIDEWGVVNNTKTFGQYDSLYYIINPIGNIEDSVYYNGNYTDSYYHSDPIRALMRYTPDDSVFFNLDRLYATETNPINLIMIVKDASDSIKDECVLHLKRKENNENLYALGPDSLFRDMLSSGHELIIKATNGASSSEPQGSQNFEMKLYTNGFEKALSLADSLNKKVALSSKKPKANTKPLKNDHKSDHK